MVAEASSSASDPPPHRRTVSWSKNLEQRPTIASLTATMDDSTTLLKSKSQPDVGTESDVFQEPSTGDTTHAGKALLGQDEATHKRAPSLTSSPPTPKLSRATSFSNGSSYQDDEDGNVFPPLDKLTIFDLLENIALPQKLESVQLSMKAQTENLRKQQQRLKSSGWKTRDRVVDEWRKRIPSADEQLDKYKKRMKQSIERLNTRWNDSKVVTAREKVSFIAGVMNIFISGYLIGAWPQYFHYWYTFQLLYFMPIRLYTYHARGYHYFLADLCYFVNMLTCLSIWVFPKSKRLFISTYCLAYGNNAVAIAMWRNSLVFHSLDKVTR
jgi:hypothetical protein